MNFLTITLLLAAIFLVTSVPARAQGMTCYIAHAQDQPQRVARLLGAVESVREGLGEEI